MSYYTECAFPKPTKTKSRKKYNGWKNKPERVCYVCGRPYAERHEIFGGSNRQISIEEGFQVDVCPEHHYELHQNITEWAKAENARLKAEMQLTYMEKLNDEGYSDEEALRVWMLLIGKNYVEGLIPE